MTEIQLEEISRRLAEDYPSIVNTAQAAEMLGVGVQKLRQMSLAGEIPAYRWGKSRLIGCGDPAPRVQASG